MRCAIYSRYSSDLQRPASIEDQIRNCRECATARGWIIQDDYVVSDQAMSGATVAGREAFDFLIRAAKAKPRPFDLILVDDTSRLARNLPDSLKALDILHFYGAAIYYVTQGIDSRDKTARQLITLNGMMDEQYIVGLADKVHRGQKGRVLGGYNPGGKCYGYINVPVEDPTRPGKYGRPAVIGVRLEICANQAQVIRRIFQLYAEGLGLARISKLLNQEGVPAPQPARTRALQAWCPSSIREMLRNERYRGVQVWNRTVKTRNPETGRKTSKDRPEKDRLRVEVPEWRIVSEELWNAVQARISTVKEQFGAKRYGGMNRTERSRQYLFSGVLVCGLCGSRIVIISGHGKRGYTKYGCPSHRYRGVCDNKLTIRQDRLEEQLLAALESRIFNNRELLDYTIGRFRQELEKRLAEIQKRGADSATRTQREAEKRELQLQATRVAEAIAAAGHSPTLLAQLASIEGQIRELDRHFETQKPVDLTASIEEMEAFAHKSLLHLRDVLRQNPETARISLLKHIKRLVLTPKEMPSGTVYDVSGGIEILVGAHKDVMQVVARDGIEPPTPAFSGLRSTN